MGNLNLFRFYAISVFLATPPIWACSLEDVQHEADAPVERLAELYGIAAERQKDLLDKAEINLARLEFPERGSEFNPAEFFIQQARARERKSHYEERIAAYTSEHNCLSMIAQSYAQLARYKALAVEQLSLPNLSKLGKLIILYEWNHQFNNLERLSQTKIYTLEASNVSIQRHFANLYKNLATLEFVGGKPDDDLLRIGRYGSHINSQLNPKPGPYESSQHNHIMLSNQWRTFLEEKLAGINSFSERDMELHTFYQELLQRVNKLSSSEKENTPSQEPKGGGPVFGKQRNKR